MSSELSIGVIIPAKDCASLIEGAVASIVRDLGPSDRLLVVDDSSADETPAVAKAAGAEVVLCSSGSGPYAARNFGAGYLAGEVGALLFFDARCLAAPGLLARHRSLLALNPLSYTEVKVAAGDSVAERAAAVYEPFTIQNYSRHPLGQYFPTCNLGARAEVFSAVGGFRVVRSGGDADLCWRVLEATGGSIGTSKECLVEWRARSEITSLRSQFRRYGASSAELLPKQMRTWSAIKRAILLPARVAKRASQGLRGGGMRVSWALVRTQLAYERGFFVQVWNDYVPGVSADLTAQRGERTDYVKGRHMSKDANAQ